MHVNQIDVITHSTASAVEFFLILLCMIARTLRQGVTPFNFEFTEIQSDISCVIDIRIHNASVCNTRMQIERMEQQRQRNRAEPHGKYVIVGVPAQCTRYGSRYA